MRKVFPSEEQRPLDLKVSPSKQQKSFDQIYPISPLPITSAKNEEKQKDHHKCACFRKIMEFYKTNQGKFEIVQNCIFLLIGVGDFITDIIAMVNFVETQQYWYFGIILGFTLISIFLNLLMVSADFNRWVRSCKWPDNKKFYN